MPKVNQPQSQTSQTKTRKTSKSRKPTSQDSDQAQSSSDKQSTTKTDLITDREVVYPEVKSKLGKLTAAQAKKFLGWSQPIGDGSFGSEYLFKDRRGVTTRCANVMLRQRPFVASLATQWMYEILHGNWKLNGESMVIGKTGLAIECQHRMVALIWAVQEWEDHPGRYLAWPKNTEPTIDCLIVTGIEEDRDTVNTINTGKPRSLSDAFFSSGLFELDPNSSKDRRQMRLWCRIADAALKMLWHRTGEDGRSLAPRCTHAEALHFLERHPTVKKAVQFIAAESDGKKVGNLIQPGTASAFLYLMAASETEYVNKAATGYGQVNRPGEDLVSLSRWDQACDFWVKLSGRAKEFNPLIETLGELFLDEETKVYLPVILGHIVKAWNQYIAGKKITAKSIELEYESDGEGTEWLAETPTVGGIDIGDGPEEDEEE